MSRFLGDNAAAIWKVRHDEQYHGDYATLHARNAGAYAAGCGEQDNAMLFDFDPTDKVILDIGSGGGWQLADYLRRGAKKVYGLEVDAGLISHVHRSFHELGISKDRYELLLPTDELPVAVDVITCLTVFMHIPLEACKAYWEWTATHLAPDGEAYFQFYQHGAGTLFYSDGTDREFMMPIEEVDVLLGDCGLRITRKRYPRHHSLKPVWTYYTCTRKD